MGEEGVAISGIGSAYVREIGVVEEEVFSIVAEAGIKRRKGIRRQGEWLSGSGEPVGRVFEGGGGDGGEVVDGGLRIGDERARCELTVTQGPVFGVGGLA